MIDEDKLLDLIDQMRVSVPKDVMEAKQLLQQKEGFLDQAQTEARRILALAEEEHRNKVEETEIVKSAQWRAEQVIEEAKAKGDSLIVEARRQANVRIAEADRYALDILRRLDNQLEQFLHGIKTGIETLEKEPGESEGPGEV